MIKRFRYTKKDGSTSDRVVFIISPSSDCDKGIDLTEFSDEERSHYEEQLKWLHKDFLDGIKEIGLNGNWRQFKVDQITKEPE